MASEPCPHGGQHLPEGEGERRQLRLPEARQAGGRQDRAGHALFFQLAQAGLHVAADVDDLKIGAQRQQLRAAPQARGADDRAAGKVVESARREGRAAHEHVAHVLARREGDDGEALGDLRGHVLGRMHGEVGAAVQHGRLELLREQPLVAELGQRRVEQLVALGLDDLDLDAQAGMQPRELVAHPLALDERQLAAPGADAKRIAHASSVPVPRR